MPAPSHVAQLLMRVDAGPRRGIVRLQGLTLSELVALWCGVFIGSVVSGFSGFAFSAAAGAVLFHVFERNARCP